MERFYKEKLRPEEFTRELVTRFLRKHIITVDDAREILASLGWSDDKIEKLIEDMWDYPSRSELQDLYEDKIITDDKLNEWFTKLGIHPKIREDMLTLTIKRATSSVMKSYVSAVEYSPDAKFLFVSGGNAHIEIWDTTTWKKTGVLSGHSMPINCLTTIPGGNRLVSGSRDGVVIVWDIQKGKSSGYRMIYYLRTSDTIILITIIGTKFTFLTI